MFKIKEILILLVVIITSSFVISTAIIYAVVSDYHRIDSGQTATIDEWGICKNVTRTSSGDIFIPTKTQAEWEAFIDNAIGVNIIDCVVAVPLSCLGTPTVTDIDNNVYNTVQIGSQCWMKESLRVTHNPSNAPITRYCYDNDPNICDIDGLDGVPGIEGGLYKWDTMMNGSVSCNGKNKTQPACTIPVQGICPDGWHIPSHYEWTLLEKTAGTTPNNYPFNETTVGYLGNASDFLRVGGASGFEGILAGYRYFTGGAFKDRGTHAYFWSSSESYFNAWHRHLSSAYSTVYRNTFSEALGYSVRCLMD